MRIAALNPLIVIQDTSKPFVGLLFMSVFALIIIERDCYVPRLTHTSSSYLLGQEEMQIAYASLQARSVSVLKPTDGPPETH